MPLLFTTLIERLTPLLTFLASLLDLIGVFIICVGASNIIYHYIAHLLGLQVSLNINHMRIQLGRSIVLALEFLLASDIIQTIVTPDYYEIGMLAILVIIRTVLTYYLHLELSHLQGKKPRHDS